jgi:hypothetical protein
VRREQPGADVSGWGSANGRRFSAQPSGVTQRSQPAEEVSAAIRSSSATASTPLPIATAPRRVGAIWLASAPTPANTGIGESSASARYAEPPTPGRPVSRPRNRATHRIAAPAAMPATPARNAVPRVTGPDRTSSARPDSSSVRIARTAAKIPHSPAKIVSAPSRHAAQPPTVSRSCGTP